MLIKPKIKKDGQVPDQNRTEAIKPEKTRLIQRQNTQHNTRREALGPNAGPNQQN